ncbi:MAG: VacJ family lipoprotein [Desulfovibrio sp.]|jgi:phospholipid-binding lipoprotein MlaA|nr:VacJ family lipoprotein [Desulfovibrio sp.]
MKKCPPLVATTLIAALLFFALHAQRPAFCAETPAPVPSDAVSPLDEDDLDQAGQIVYDPLEGFNRAVFEFNDFMLEQVARPVNEAYVFVTPGFLRSGLSNFFHNLNFPVRFASNLLQGRPLAAGVEMSRFILNTTAGLGGFFNVAQYHESFIPVEDEDMGQTLGVWGIGEGFYIVWPFAGPRTLRDSVGWAADHALSPTTYVRPWELSLGLWGVEVFNDLDKVLDLYDNLKQGAVEPYSAVRNAYTQYRRVRISK